MKFKHLGIENLKLRDVETEVRIQTMRATRTAARLNVTIWKKKYLRIETKAKRPVLTHIPKILPDVAKTKRMLDTGEGYVKNS